MKHILTVFVLVLFGFLLGAEYTIHNAKIYRESDVYCMDVFGQIHEYTID